MLARAGHAAIDSDANGDGSAIWGNTQAGHSESSFSSAVRRNETTPSKRRRGSDVLGRRGRTDHDPWATEGSHSRSRTVDDEAGVGNHWVSGRSTSQHPLRSSSNVASSSTWTLDHETRPTLRRMLGDQDKRTDEELEHRRDESVHRDREMLVIVHEVQPTDSLAGVALKYGITLAELRRANQLWTSDSIHLRKVLYIPVDKTRQAKHLREALVETFMPKDDVLPPSASTLPDADTELTHHPPTTDTDLPDIGKLTLRRVPASQLSYFPPSTHASSLLDSSQSSTSQSSTIPNGRSARSRQGLPSSFIPSSESTLQGVLDIFSSIQTTVNQVRANSQSSNLFGGPVVRAPPTLASRLSLDSSSATPSTPSEDLDWEHEMEDVSAALSKNARRRQKREARTPDPATRIRVHAKEASASLNDLNASPPSVQEREERDSVELDSGPFASNGSPPHTPTRRHRRDSSGRSRRHVTPPSMGSSSKGRGRPAVPYAGTDEEAAVEWGSPGRGKSIVRTAQLEPTAGMQLPLLSRRSTKSRD